MFYILSFVVKTAVSVVRIVISTVRTVAVNSAIAILIIPISIYAVRAIALKTAFR